MCKIYQDKRQKKLVCHAYSWSYRLSLRNKATSAGSHFVFYLCLIKQRELLLDTFTELLRVWDKAKNFYRAPSSGHKHITKIKDSAQNALVIARNIDRFFVRS
jgi:hypothetical protein